MINRANIFWGVDFGAKLAGTTAVAAWQPETKGLTLYQSEKKQDADLFLKRLAEEHRPRWIAFDAPLSLPGVYRGLAGYRDYFYRLGDRQLQAMSPMFLGGLTARAMQLADFWRLQGATVLETYPAATARLIPLASAVYKKEPSGIEGLKPVLAAWLGIDLNPISLPDWHSFDALLALSAALRFDRSEAVAYGDVIEGMIWL